MPHYSHLVARMIWRQVIGRTSIWGGGGLVWCEPEYHPFLQIILVLNLWCGKELNQFPPPTSSDDLSPLFCLILLLCREHCVYSVSGPGRYLAWKSLCTAHTTVHTVSDEVAQMSRQVQQNYQNYPYTGIPGGSRKTGIQVWNIRIWS